VTRFAGRDAFAAGNVTAPMEVSFGKRKATGNKKRFLDRCRDAAMQRHDFVLILDDEDLGLLVKEAKGILYRV
jgi:hypothetical protein